MFNIGFSEMVLLAVIALVVIGPKQLPQMARTLARFLNELRSVTDDVKKTFTDVQNEAEQGLRKFRESAQNETQKIEQSLIQEPKKTDDGDQQNG